MAIQICRMFGANPIPVVGGAEKIAKAEELGATDVIDRKSQDVVAEVKRITGKAGADVVFEHSGEETWPTSMASLRWGGRLVVCGASTGFNAVTDLRFLWNKQQNLLGSHLSNKAELSAALKAVERGDIKPVIDQVLPLSDVGKGQQLMEDLKVQGKVVYVP
jgi:alcohol dehydrogenase